MKQKSMKGETSKGIIIPAGILKHTSLTEGYEVEVSVTSEGDILISREKKNLREGWGEAFKKFAEDGGDQDEV